MEIGAWLQSLGLERYEMVFRDNAIDSGVLPELSDANLEKLGVLLGHRKRLLKAIAALHDQQSSKSAAELSTSMPASTKAERRQLTVMFCDLVGSTALAAYRDPEEMHELIRNFQSVVSGEIARFEGHVAKFTGDGVLAYFGWPNAHEDEAEHAVRAGLAIVEAITGMPSPTDTPLNVRVRIATGLVVVGDLIGQDEARERVVVRKPGLCDSRRADVLRADLRENYREGAIYVDQILKGAHPGDLPVIQGNRLECVLNTKAAQAIGLTFPVALLAVADEVIE